ncbi:MAG TPA: hypothetical protein VE687_04805 [Stellaceae bacterium]|jgi:beta-phosphoglucomutase-like phosphatase (HAD superfamily)|nr:hypothetical protein [Stellaceae bacterium]
MSELAEPAPELYREAAEQLKLLAEQSLLVDIKRDLLGLAERFERIAADYEVSRTDPAPR